MIPIPQHSDIVPFQAITYTSATECLDAIEHILIPHELECSTNFVYSHLTTSRTLELTNQQHVGSPIHHPQRWIGLWGSSKQYQTCNLDFILTVTNGAQGHQPIFIAPVEFDLTRASTKEIDERMRYLATSLQAAIPTERVFSVNGPAVITKRFAEAWSNLTHALLQEDPYTITKPLSCSVSHQSLSSEQHKRIRLAEASDLPRISRLLEQSSWQQEPYILDPESASQLSEAAVQAKKCFVLDDTDVNGNSSLCAFAFLDNLTQRTATITKFSTDTGCMGQSCGFQLLIEVIDLFLKRQRKDRVFILLREGTDVLDSISSSTEFQSQLGWSWLEVGFEDREVGYW
ncbi:hypothetical protein FRC03_007378 [Tulasnella sp. 419]|nr:hypothetical protein FRC02_005929 [Tulasnella sp. 418]KAG8968436.1 hypothetical protein FRC03_007378 [Tulasnella sp. 419]